MRYNTNNKQGGLITTTWTTYTADLLFIIYIITYIQSYNIIYTQIQEHF